MKTLLVFSFLFAKWYTIALIAIAIIDGNTVAIIVRLLITLALHYGYHITLNSFE